MANKKYILIRSFKDLPYDEHTLFRSGLFGTTDRYCPFCKSYTVHPVAEKTGPRAEDIIIHIRIGKCEICGHIRKIPRPMELSDLADPENRKFFVDLINACHLPKLNPPLKFKGNIRSQGIFY